LTLQEKLKAQTQVLHNELEQQMFVQHIMQKTLNIEQYKKLLACNYLVHNLYEEEIFNKLTTEIALSIDVEKRTKLTSLIKDLHEAKISEQALEQINIDNIEFVNEYTALGSMYVLEGATLGGSVIIKQLRLNSNFDSLFKFNYYGIYGKDLITNWQQFLSQLNTIPETHHDEVILGAENMFKEIIKISEKLKKVELN
jgi:heme oxygenase